MRNGKYHYDKSHVARMSLCLVHSAQKLHQHHKMCLCVMRREGMVCCLRWCAFVQSGTVSVQPHPWFWSGDVLSTLLWPTSTTQWMGGAESLSLSQSSLLCSELEDHSSCSGHRPNSNPNPLSPSPTFLHLSFLTPSKIHLGAPKECLDLITVDNPI